jgi:hypothetical protein
VIAGYEPDVPSIDLLFDRDIDLSRIDLGAFIVADGNIAACTWVGSGTILLGSRWVQVLLTRVGDFSGPDVRLNAGPWNGIVAMDDGGAWPGAVGLVLPFG